MATSGGGVFLSTNNGTSWAAANAGLTKPDVLSLAVSGMNLFAGTDGGVWRRPLWEMITSMHLSSSALPTEFSLELNYPNPFIPSTTIRYGLPHKSTVQLTVYNTPGQQVALLVRGEMEAGYHNILYDNYMSPGIHLVPFEGNGLASGVYFYKPEAGSIVNIRKMILMK